MISVNELKNLVSSLNIEASLALEKQMQISERSDALCQC